MGVSYLSWCEVSEDLGSNITNILLVVMFMVVFVTTISCQIYIQKKLGDFSLNCKYLKYVVPSVLISLTTVIVLTLLVPAELIQKVRYYCVFVTFAFLCLVFDVLFIYKERVTTIPIMKSFLHSMKCWLPSNSVSPVGIEMANVAGSSVDIFVG